MVVTNRDGDDTALELVVTYVTPSDLRHFGCYFWDGLEPFPVSLAPSQDFYGKAVADPRREGHIKQCASGPGKLGVATGNIPRFITIYVLACVLMRLDFPIDQWRQCLVCGKFERLQFVNKEFLVVFYLG